MKPGIKKIALYTGLIAMSWLIVGIGVARHNSRDVKEFRTVVSNEENNHFLGREDVIEIVEGIQGEVMEETPRGEVKVAEIEAGLRENPYVKDAEVFKQLNGNVVAELELRKPLARVLYEDGSGFYLDQDYRKLDLSSRYSANVILVRGLDFEPLMPRDTIDNPQISDLREFLEYVDGDDFLRSQISEVVMDDDGELTLYSEVGDLVIEFGTPDRIEDKFDNMKLFFDKVLNQVGWDQYEEISLKYRGQVVAR